MDDVEHRAYLNQKQADVRSAAKQKREGITAIQEIADSAKCQAALAEKKAKKADIKGIVAIIVSVLALLVSFMANHKEIFDFFSQLFGR